MGICYDFLIDLIFGIYYILRRKSLPKASDPILLESATYLAQKIRKKEITSEKVVHAYIERIKEVNSIINAIVDDRFEDALKEAKQIDYDIAKGKISDADFEKKNFLGVPFTTKESTACKGLSWSFGLKKRLGKKAPFDADCIDSVKKAGGILLGVSNVPQLNLWQETSNPIYGVTKNPYNTTRYVGGSSGGEGSILAACGSPIGIGTDIGGSVRNPAFMCGLFGHKISSNLVPLKGNPIYLRYCLRLTGKWAVAQLAFVFWGANAPTGLTYRTGEETNSIISVGPMTRYADDLIPMIKVLVGNNAAKLKLDSPVAVDNLKIYFIRNPRDPSISPFKREMKNVFSRVVEYFQEICSQRPHSLRFKDLKYTSKLWKYWMTQEGSNLREDVNNREGEVDVILEVIQHFTVGGDFTTATIFSLINGLSKVNEAWAVETTNSLKEELLSKLDENSVLLYPSAPFPASYHNTPLLRPYNFNTFSIWNVMKFPVTQVPMGLGKKGLPLGIQVVAAPFQDRLCIAVAKELEKHFGGFVPP